MAAYGDTAMGWVRDGIARGLLDPDLDPRIAGEVLLDDE